MSTQWMVLTIALVLPFTSSAAAASKRRISDEGVASVAFLSDGNAFVARPARNPPSTVGGTLESGPTSGSGHGCYARDGAKRLFVGDGSEAGCRCERYESCERCERCEVPARIAIPSDTGRYGGGYVGGGGHWLGCDRCPLDGTWGWDYEGLLVKKRIWLSWLHGRRHQGGGGKYKTDGAHFPHP